MELRVLLADHLFLGFGFIPVQDALVSSRSELLVIQAFIQRRLRLIELDEPLESELISVSERAEVTLRMFV